MSDRRGFQLTASVFVMLVKNSKICMLRRKGTGWMDGIFSIPAGGFEAHETLSAAAIREAHEEVGVHIEQANLKHVHTIHSKTGGQIWFGHFFRTTIWDGIPLLRERDKHSDLQWRALDSLPSETIPYVRRALSSIAQQETYSEYGWTD